MITVSKFYQNDGEHTYCRVGMNEPSETESKEVASVNELANYLKAAYDMKLDDLEVRKKLKV